MSVDFTKYKRGSIWFYREPQWIEQQRGVQSHSRPCVIISNDNFNSYSPVVNVLMLTTNLDKDNEYHINIYKNGYNTRLRDSAILVEQIKTIPISDLGEYFGMLSDDIMKEVDRKLIKHLNIENTPHIAIEELGQFMGKYKETIDTYNQISSNSFMNELKDHISDFIRSKGRAERPRLTSENIVKNSVANKVINDSNSDNNSKENVFNNFPKNGIIIDENGIKNNLEKNLEKSIDLNKPIESTIEKIKEKRRKKWTSEEMSFFIDNYDNKELLMNKYNLTRQQVVKTYFYIKSKVAN
jgi:mRNA-degrading endonuclease toxin of MazEF toxin-antitoxin module